MRRFLAILTIIALLLPSAPASARRTYIEKAPLFVPGAPTQAVNNPCDLGPTFSGLHGDVTYLATEAKTAGGTALGLRLKSRWIDYKQIEDEWGDINNRSVPALDQLAHLPSAIDTAPPDDVKQAALTLISTYQTAIAQIVDYGHNVVFYERTQNAKSGSSPIQARKINYGRSNMNSRSFHDITARQLLDGKVNQVTDALDSLKLPEYKYGEICRIGLRSLPSTQAPIDDPCSLTQEFLDTHATLHQLATEAIHYGNNLRYLRRETRYRPFKNVEDMWYKVSNPSNDILDHLSDLPLALADAPNNPRKEVALDLITTYQSALKKIVDYAHFVVYTERVDNQQATSSNILLVAFSFQILAGVSNTKVNQRNTGRSLISNQVNQAADAIRALNIPEYRYAKACHAPLGPPAPTPINDPCLLADSFLQIHQRIGELGEEAQDAGNRVRKTHNTSMRKPFILIDRDWRHVWQGSQPVLDALSRLPLLLEDTLDSPEKEEALDLAADYQNTVTRIVDFAHIAEFNRDTQNSLGWNFRAGSAGPFFAVHIPLGFGIAHNTTRAVADNVASNQLEQRFSEVNDAFRSLKLPEHRYGQSCQVAFSRLKAKVQ